MCGCVTIQFSDAISWVVANLGRSTDRQIDAEGTRSMDGASNRPICGGAATVVHLIDGPFITVGNRRQQLPEGCKRLIAFVALRKGPLTRGYVAGSLWPTVHDVRASGNLRSAVWRLREAHVDVVTADRWSVWLTPGTAVDVDNMRDWAHRVVSHNPLCSDFRTVCDKVRGLDILPGIYDDWAIVERERMRQQILHALEVVSHLLAAQGRFGEAVEAALAAVFCEPLRESAQRALVESYLAEGNLCEAKRAYIAYAMLIARELDAKPSPTFASLFDSLERSPEAVVLFAGQSENNRRNSATAASAASGRRNTSRDVSSVVMSGVDDTVIRS